ncbi:uncharacterized protein LOC114455582 isoform X2 [Gouania willdenowi]|uniref:uncharacterized protein LOC114455582 isoform X2 n=1 Tax=Gouania willdenowi TaxID=441366 RepID=UPI001055C3F3|nr:uncharacterized protein LOC114455582 isoform X2 [Gouania willdenowi]
MFWVFLIFQAFTQALSKVPPPQNIYVANWLLIWTEQTEDRELFYTVQSRSILDNNWKDIPACVQIALNFCNVTSTKIHGNHAGCVMLRVQAERDGLTSIPVEACSSQGEPCTPQFSLTARPGSLTVHLSGDHSLAQEYGAHVKHRIYLGKKGESLKEHSDAASSLTIKELEEGQQYCAKVQYVTLLSNDTELSSCIQCESIPFSGSKEKKITAGVFTILLIVILIVGIVYICIFHRRTIKHWMQPPCEIPVVFLQPISGKHKSPLISSPVDEQCDVLSIIESE